MSFQINKIWNRSAKLTEYSNLWTHIKTTSNIISALLRTKVVVSAESDIRSKSALWPVAEVAEDVKTLPLVDPGSTSGLISSGFWQELADSSAVSGLNNGGGPPSINCGRLRWKADGMEKFLVTCCNQVACFANLLSFLTVCVRVTEFSED